MFKAHYREAIEFRPEHFNPVVLAENERVKVILACFEPGQFIPVHRPGIDLISVVLEGEGRLVIGDQETKVGPGATFFVPAGETRGILASTRLVIMHIVTPPPTEADHVQVRAGLQRGSWR